MLQILLERFPPASAYAVNMNSADDFVAITPEILYFGTPVAVISSLNPDGTTNLAAMSSFWALGDRLMLGLSRFGQTCRNLERTPECVLNLSSPQEWEHVERLGHTTGRLELTEYHRGAGIAHARDKFAVSGFTPTPSERVVPLGVAECPVRIEARILIIHAASDEAPFAYMEARKLLVGARRRVLDITGTRFDIESWSPLLYLFRHYYGKGAYLGKSFRARDS